MFRVAVACAGVFAVLLAAAAGTRAEEAKTPPSPPPDPRLAALVERELAALAARTAADLVHGVAPRALVDAGSFTLPHSDGRARIVVLGLAPGPPGNLPVPTQMEALRFLVGEGAGGELSVGERPARADLVTAVERVLADESKAIAAAEAAMTASGAALPPGRASWRDALRSATYDARLPRDRYHGEPGWHFIFEPWDEAHGGWHGVLLGPGLAVQSVDGRKPGSSR